jgi:hypothetical protein
MLPQVPEPARHPNSTPDRRAALARAAVSPSAVVVTAAGFLIGLAAQSLTLAIVLAVVGWLGRMVVAIARTRRRLPLVKIDPIALSEPWREYVRQALAAGQRFAQAISGWPDGPLRDRLELLQPRLDRAVEEVWTVAQQGAALDGTVRGVRTSAARPSVEQLSDELRRVQAERQQTSAPDRQAALARSEEAIAAQVRAARQSESARAEVLDRLRLLTARLDDAVTRLETLGLDRPAAEGSVEEVAGSVESLIDEIGALHQGLQEADAAAAGPRVPPGIQPRGPTPYLPPARPPQGLGPPSFGPDAVPPPDPHTAPTSPGPDALAPSPGPESVPPSSSAPGPPTSPPATP